MNYVIAFVVLAVLVYIAYRATRKTPEDTIKYPPGEYKPIKEPPFAPDIPPRKQSHLSE